ncbi:hypothetical protein K435DRAFT_119314 [Dendrothele bispora CBS 962.96]|uniref:RRM domain-containing protein n=1 Tax=Dendrothele bispora (strain CBS 962.96) TaxID=1314807 RepID=A0A4V4HI52_DENBC|nr:hypothetical protein K435DRAFT_119314 [Dendrothele bispora CBS 962.96]
MFANSLRAGLRSTRGLIKPGVFSSRIVRLPAAATARLPTSSTLCRTFASSRVTQEENEVSSTSSTDKGATNNDKRVIYFSNLPWNIELDEVKELAERFGDLEQITMPNDENGRFAGFANVVFHRHEDAVALLNYAKTSGPMTFNGRRSMLFLMDEPQQQALPRAGLQNPSGRWGVQQHKGSNSVFIGNIPFEADADRLREDMSAFGEVTRVQVAQDRQGRPRGYAHIDYASADDASRLVQEHLKNPIEINGRSLIIDLSRPRRQESGSRSPVDKTQSPHHTLYFNRFEGDVEDLRELLSSHTPVFIKFISSETGQPGRKGFIRFDSVSEATAALKMVRSEFRDVIWVDFAKGRSEEGARNKASYGGDWEGGKRSSGYARSK